MKLTKEIIHQFGSGSGGWNKEQLKLLGINWPPEKGWINRISGKEIPDAIFEKLVLLRGLKKKKLRACAMTEDLFS